jgi:orotate phosphoribosyltransferase
MAPRLHRGLFGSASLSRSIMSLFKQEKCILSSGKHSSYKIDCDALSNDDIETAAYLLSKLTHPFGKVEGVPRGGLRLAQAMQKYTTRCFDLLIVDDVWTTGGSVRKYLADRKAEVAVIFARGKTPPEVISLFTIHNKLQEEFK